MIARAKLIVCLLAACAVSHAAVLTLTPDRLFASAGEQVEIFLSISGLGDNAAPALGGYSLTVLFPSSLTFDNAVFGDPGLGDQLDLTGAGSIAVSGLNMDGSGVNLLAVSFETPQDLTSLQKGEFRLASLLFQVQSTPASRLTVKGTLADEVGNNLAFTSGAAVINAPEPNSAALLLVALPMLFLGASRFRKNQLQ